MWNRFSPFSHKIIPIPSRQRALLSGYHNPTTLEYKLIMLDQDWRFGHKGGADKGKPHHGDVPNTAIGILLHLLTN